MRNHSSLETKLNAAVVCGGSLKTRVLALLVRAVMLLTDHH